VEELLPVLTAWLEDGPQLTITLEAALAGDVAHLPLETPPFEQTTHILEIHVVGAPNPLLLLADPVGFATQGSFPLQIRPFDDEQRQRLQHVLLLTGAADSRERLSSLPPPPSQDHQARRVSRPQADPLVGASIGLGKFEIEQLLGSGAAGRVYRAMHRDLQKGVAVKVLHPFYQSDPQYAVRFQGEARTASKIDHPNVLRILDFGQEADGMLYIVMEFLEGHDLASVLEREGPLPLERLVPIAMQICAGLSEAHEAGIIHRDIKPENVILVGGRDDEGNIIEVAKVCDFGIAQMRTADEGAAERVICGTPEYMSPEQWQAQALDARTDIYALGATLYEMATRFVPFTGQNTDEVFMKALTQEAPPPSLYNADIDPRLQAIILKCLAKDPAQRYANARELRTELRALVEPLDGAARLARRRELLDASKLTPLDDPSAGFPEFFIALASAVLRTGYYERNHPEAATALARFAASTDMILKNRGELSFARRDVGEQIVFTVVSGVGEVKELKKLLPPSVFELYADKFGDVFFRRSVVSLALRDGVDEVEIADLVELLSGPEIPAEELRAKFLKRGFTSVSILFVADLLGRKRRLPWQVDLCVSRLARDLKALPLVRGMGVDELRVLRTQIIGDVIRALGKPEQLRILLDNSDLIEAETSNLDELAGVDIMAALVDGLSVRAAAGLARYLLEEMDTGVKAKASGSAPAMLAVRLDPKDMLKVIAARFARDRTTDSDDVLRQLYDKSFLALPDLPRDLQMWIKAEEHATAIVGDPESALASVDRVTDPEAYDHEIAALEFAVRVLARRSEVAGVLAILERFKKHATDAKRPARMRQRAYAGVAVLEEPDVLGCVAHTLLGGSVSVRDVAQRLVAGAGAKAAAPLVEARLQLGQADASARARFVAAFREIGAPGWSVLAQKLDGFGLEAEPAVIEDFLRAVPEVSDPEGGRIVERFSAHPVPLVRRAAATALAALSGAAARQPLVVLFSGKDDGVRLGALAGLRRIKTIDAEVVACIDKILGGEVAAGEELRAASAAALVDAKPDARPTALAMLSRVVRPQRKSLVGLLKDAMHAPVHDSTMVLVASARALVTLGGDKGKEIVRERVSVSAGVVKQQLEALL
jgi:serine/threonine-protein kinase